jgi:putative iron-dependent peroxidase
MLEHMFLGDPPGNHDRILEFSTPLTGTLFFVPSQDFLDDLPDPPSSGTASDAPEPELEHRNPAEGSLGIGDLGRSTTR